MSYDPNVKVYYGTNGSSSDRLEPAPQISISTEFSYANDTVIGYSYIITLSGNVTALKLSNNSNTYGLKSLSNRINETRRIFSLNGGNLYVINTDDNSTILEARGGIVRSISIEESNNNWVNYAPYKIEIVFNELLINGCSVSESLSCNDLSISSGAVSPNLLDIQKYKIKEFNDSWSFNISDEAYNNYSIFQNQYIDIEYSVSATGKHFFTENNNVLPAWEQAKNFVQDRLFTQVRALIGSILNRTNTTDGCSASKNLTQIHATGSPGGLSISASHKIYNETISCEVSESNGTFSATYKAILKYNSNILGSDCIHTFSKSTSIQDDNKSKKISISVQGTITGLIPGGLINSPNTIQLPKSGQLFLSVSNNTVTKYSQALQAYSQISSGSDISNELKDILGITNSELIGDSQPPPCVNMSDYPSSVSFTNTHDYTGGIITYTAEYNNDRVCLSNGTASYRNISISIEDSVPVVVEFVIPGRSGGPIVQRTGAYTPKRVSINIEGVTSNTECLCNLATGGPLSDICATGIGLPGDLPPVFLGNNYKLTQNQATVNTIDGSYSINRSYIVI